MCGGHVLHDEVVVTVRVPGNPKTRHVQDPEWVCPDCEYFEDAEEER